MVLRPAEGDGRLVLLGRIMTDGRALPRSRVGVEGGRIERVEVDVRGGAGADGAPALDAGDGWIVPGLVDLQVNGAGGIDLTSADDPAGAVVGVGRVLARHGVTAFCPTVVSSRVEVVLARIAAYTAGVHGAGAVAESLGVHVEGPFINPRNRGVHDPAVLREATEGEVERWLRAGTPAIVTLAAEMPGGLVAIRRFAEAGSVVSLGHSGATAEQARAGLAAGARMGTHLFNAMPPLHHREPGLVGALLADGEATVGLIADGVHVDRVAVEVVIRAAGSGRVALVSDCLAAAGMPAGPSLLGDQAVVSDGRSVRRADGTLAGSALLLDGCLRNVLEWLPWMAPADVVRMATETPTRMLGREVAARKGRVAVGYDADMVVLGPDWRVRETVVRGARV